MIAVSSGKADDHLTPLSSGGKKKKTMKIKKSFGLSLKFKLSQEWLVDQDPCINISVTQPGGQKNPRQTCEEDLISM